MYIERGIFVIDDGAVVWAKAKLATVPNPKVTFIVFLWLSLTPAFDSANHFGATT